MSEKPRTLRVAIVDDEPSVRVSLRRLCTVLGMEATAYASGHLFLDSLLNSVVADCVLLDMHMPEMSGLEVQHRMASFTDTVAVIAISADDSPETRVRWLTGGALACLHKPIGADELVALMTTVLEWQNAIARRLISARPPPTPHASRQFNRTATATATATAFHAEARRTAGGPRKALAQCRLDADPKVFFFGVVDGEERCAGASSSTRRAVLRVLRVSA